MEKNKKLDYDDYIGEFLGYRVFTSKRFPIDHCLVNIILVNIFLDLCKKEKERCSVNGLGENRGRYLNFMGRVHWEDKEMSIIDYGR